MENKMKEYQAIIETPEGDNRRRHFDKKQNKVVDLQPLEEVIPVNNGIAPVNYGFIKNTHCDVDGDEIDLLLLSENKYKVGEAAEIIPIALIKRADGDDKIVGVDKATISKYKEWQDVPKEKRNLIEKFFSYHFKFISIENSIKAEEYLKEHKIK